MAKQHDIERRKIELLFDQSPKEWWWLSFADPKRPKGTQFLGVAIIKAANIRQAAEFARYLHHCNPGGEVAGEPFYDVEPPAEFTNRLLSRSEVDRLESYLSDNADRLIAERDAH